MKMLLYFFGISIILLACSDNGSRAGTDTGNPMLEVAVADSLGKPLAGAQVTIYPQSTGGAALRRISCDADCAASAETFVTDSRGRLSVPLAVGSRIGFEVYWNEDLGAYQSLVVRADTKEIHIQATPLVSFPTNEDVVLAGTGRKLPASSITKIPPGLWQIQYVRAGSRDSLPLIDVQVDDAANLPGALRGLSIAASEMQRLDVEPHGYVEFADYPTDSVVLTHLDSTCVKEGYPEIANCKGNGKCRIWQWESDWVTQEDSSPVLAAAVSFDDQIVCVVFPDEAVSHRPAFYPYSKVRKAP